MTEREAKELVTVVIPAYKCEKVIASAIESVLGQTYGNVELIVVDDGSPDDVEGAIERYRGRLRYIRQENGGVSKARNTGILQANGKYVAFLDSDDTWDRNKLAIQVSVLERHPEVNLLFSAFHVTRNGKILGDKNYRASFNFFKEYKYDIPDIFANRSEGAAGDIRFDYYWGDIYDKLFLGNFILPSSVIARKKSLVECGLFSDRFKVAEETDFFLRFASRNEIGFIDSPLVFYEVPNPDNLSGKNNMEPLMKNAYRIQIDSMIENLRYLRKSPGYYYKGISNTYCRLAYYYLSELKKDQCRRYAGYAITVCRSHAKPYLLYALSMVPAGLLRSARELKSRL